MEKIIQFGEGNFLRAFAQEYIQDSEYSKDVITQPRTNTKVINALNSLNCEYDIVKRGRFNGEVVDEKIHIHSVSRCIYSVEEYDKLVELFKSDDLEIVISNTTEAGICYEEGNLNTFPAKLARLLCERYCATNKPLTFFPVELIENNADELKKCIIKYCPDFDLPVEYVEACTFCNTLVDRIVTGTIDDKCTVACEPYRSWIIQSDKKIANIDATYTDNIIPYRTRKVRILNGAHTMSVLAAYMCGITIVRDMMNDVDFARYISLGLEEIKQTIDLPKEELDEFANSVVERFNNPFIDHKLLDISLNSISKFEVRCLDTIFDYIKINGEYPNSQGA